MASFDIGKDIVTEWIRANFPTDSTILDVGACDGKWRRYLPEYPNMDAVDIWPANAEMVRPIYRNVFCEDVIGMKYDKYDLIIFGDVIEHMKTEDAKKVLRYAKTRCRDLIVAVPFLYPQGPLQGNPYETHLQPDLTHEKFMERYPGFEILHDTKRNYCFYHKRTKK